MRLASSLLLAAALVLTGCDAATEIAGDTIETELRRGVVAQCEQVAEGAGIAAGRVSAVCQCSADQITADGNISISDLTREKLQGVVQSCVARTDPDGVGR